MSDDNHQQTQDANNEPKSEDNKETINIKVCFTFFFVICSRRFLNSLLLGFLSRSRVLLAKKFSSKSNGAQNLQSFKAPMPTKWERMLVVFGQFFFFFEF